MATDPTQMSFQLAQLRALATASRELANPSPALEGIANAAQQWSSGNFAASGAVGDRLRHVSAVMGDFERGKAGTLQYNAGFMETVATRFETLSRDRADEFDRIDGGDRSNPSQAARDFINGIGRAQPGVPVPAASPQAPTPIHDNARDINLDPAHHEQFQFDPQRNHPDRPATAPDSGGFNLQF